MTRDDIIRLAREAGIVDWSLHGRLESKEEALERFAALVAAAEREACADIASTCCEGCADDIRARGENK